MSGKQLMKVIGAACDIGAPDSRCGQGPEAVWRSGQKMGLALEWGEIVEPPNDLRGVENMARFSSDLAAAVAAAMVPGPRIAIVGGDHACAIGTWNGVARRVDGALGLIWIDAHMDSHTPDTTPSGQWHGMPVATLLGHGATALTGLSPRGYVVRPEHLVLVGVRSYEPAEKALLQRLGVKVFSDDDVDRIGLANVMKEAQRIVSSGTAAWGISLDLDGLDIRDAPGVGSPVVGGLRASDVLAALEALRADSRFVALEIVEFNPVVDVEKRTRQLVLKLLATFNGEKNGG